MMLACFHIKSQSCIFKCVGNVKYQAGVMRPVCNHDFGWGGQFINMVSEWQSMNYLFFDHSIVIHIKHAFLCYRYDELVACDTNVTNS